MGHPTVKCRTLRRHLQGLINQGYLREFVLNPVQPSKIKVQKEPPPQVGQAGNTLIQSRELNAIFATSPIDGTTRKRRVIYVNEAQKDGYPAILTSPPSSRGRHILSSDANAYVVHFQHNDALVVTMHIDCCRMSKILIDGGSSVNILYGHALDRMEDTLVLARKMVLP